MSINKFESTKKLIPACIYGIGTTLLLYFVVISALNNDMCEKGSG